MDIAQLSRTYGRSGDATTASLRLRSEGAQEPVAEGVHPPDRRLRSGLQAVLPAPAGHPVQHGVVAGDDRDRYVPAGALTGDDRGGLVVAEEDQDEVVVPVGLHVGDERVDRVLDGLEIRGADAAAVAQLLR